MNLLLVAAEPREFRGLLRRCREVQRPDWRVAWARRGQLKGGTIWMVANGAGPHRAAQAAGAACDAAAPDAVASVGFCGALAPALRPGDVLVANSILCVAATPGVSSTCGAVAPQSDRPHSCGALLSLPYVVQTAEQKQILHRSGAAAVDMEAAGVVRIARRRGLPFYCIRVVTDTATESFANDFNAVLGQDGFFHAPRLIWHALGSPRDRFPELLRLHRRCRLASRRLGDFLADCRF